MRLHFIASLIVLLSTLQLFTGTFAHAQIYKWVDEDGQVHFGDKPKDGVEAESAQKVEVKQAYQPAARSEEDINRSRAEQESRWMEEQALRREEQEEQSAERVKLKKERQDECDRLRKKIENFSGIRVINGRRTRHVFVDSEGKSLTTNEQNQRIIELEELAASKGCP